MKRAPKPRRTLLASLIGATLLLGSVAVAVYIPDAVARDVVIWEPASIDVTLEPGEKRTISASITTRQTLRSAQISLPASLSPYLTVSPTSLGTVPSNSTVVVEIQVSAGEGSRQLVDVIQLVDSSGRTTRPISRAANLEFHLRVLEPSLPKLDATENIRIGIPGSFETVSSGDTNSAFEDKSSSGFLVSVEELPAGGFASVEDWVVAVYFDRPEMSLEEYLAEIEEHSIVLEAQGDFIAALPAFRLRVRQEAGEGLLVFLLDQPTDKAYVIKINPTDPDQIASFDANSVVINEIIDSIVIR